MATADWEARVGRYVVGLLVLALLGAIAGSWWFDASCDPSDPEVTECDLGAVHAVAWAVVGVLVAVVVSTALEVVLAVRRWTASTSRVR